MNNAQSIVFAFFPKLKGDRLKKVRSAGNATRRLLMRLALFSDIHGNPLALDAVLADIDAACGGVDTYWVLGDLVTLGYDPAGVLERLHRLPDVHCTYGNTDFYLLAYAAHTDRYLVTGQHPFRSLEEISVHPHYVRSALEVAKSYAWTHGYLAAGGWMQWLATLPLEVRMTLPDGTRLLGVHAAPGAADGVDLHPGLTDAEILALVAECGADLVCVGHSHVAMERVVNKVRVVNLGSVSPPVSLELATGGKVPVGYVSGPFSPHPQASYVLLEADPSGYTVEHHFVPYDRQAVMDTIRQSGHPTSEYLIQRFLR
jgi:predicted phosphodiesterase